MFEFLFKRQGDKPDGTGAEPQADQPAAPGPTPREQQAALLSQLAGNEQAAADFILHSEFSDLRLAAAEHVHSPEHLERVYNAIRNTDRRVAKLMHGRLDAHRHHQAEVERARAAIEQARQLAQDDRLSPNQVADLDRRWSVIDASELTAEFTEVRAQLTRRLEAQVALQRRVIDALAELRALSSSASAAADDARIEQLLAMLEGVGSEPEHVSLPRHLLNDAQALAAQLHASRDARRRQHDTVAAPAQAAAGANGDAGTQQRAGQEAPSGAVAELLAGRPVEGQDGVPDDGAAATSGTAEGAALPPPVAGEAAHTAAPGEGAHSGAPGAGGPADVADAQAAPGAAAVGPGAAANGHAAQGAAASGHAAQVGAARAPAAGAPRAKQPKPNLPPPDKAFLDKVDAFETAIQEGALHVAADLDKELKETKGFRLGAGLTDRLARARAEMKRLNDWARWGGNISREELIKAAEVLKDAKMAMSELAQKVGSLRDRWKKLDTVSGAAPKALWERFDAACTAAYAPAAAHFKHLADERHANAAKGQALLDEANAEVGRFQVEGSHDWKHLAATVQRLTLAWSHLGAIDRKEKKRLDTEFHRALQVLEEPLGSRREHEREQREALIDEVRNLNPHDRHMLDALRSAQERWQHAAKALPLERKAEQALWQRFRAACDEVFNRRKESAHAADAERKAHQVAKEAICARLEQLDDVSNAPAALRQAASEWHAIGPVPRANEAKLDKRYHAAISAVQHKVDSARRAASVAQASRLRDKLRLVQELEDSVANGGDTSTDWEARWTALPALQPADLESTLERRFRAALDARNGNRDGYVTQLKANQTRLMDGLLRLEIVAGVDSGAEFARDRLRLQVEVLQTSLKSGQKPVTQFAQFLELLALPALSDARSATRLEHLYPRIGRDHR